MPGKVIFGHRTCMAGSASVSMQKINYIANYMLIYLLGAFYYLFHTIQNVCLA